MPALLRPPSHRGPLVATGAVVLTAGVALQQLRLGGEWDAGVHLLLTGALAALFLWLAMAAPLEGGRPPAYQSVLLVCGLLALLLALAWAADALGADFGGYPAGALTAVFAAHAGAAFAFAVRRASGIAALLGAISAAGAVLSAVDWIFDPSSATPFRWLLLLLAIAFVAVSLLLRASRQRPSEQLVNAAGLAILAIPVSAVAESFLAPRAPVLGGFWEVVTLAAGFGLIAYAGADRAPGPAYLGALNLAAFAVVTSLGVEPTLEWWPATLIVAGLALLATGLRPARPLPPEPPAYRAGDVPLSARAEDDETVVRVRE